MRYVAIIEPTHNGFTAYSPDLPVCSVNSLTEEKAAEALKEALKRHIKKLKQVGLETPQSYCKTAIIEITSLGNDR
ncbi:type II toxin-antitoxin system HicB family antitoxin [Methylomicrobium sp. RS1]|jgi:predicted RNase H-like HicB family nuclease|uniref:type II toxin-antitoxin system HicB family antitoxin n=1 Tax=Candidatus Methylomicrobium oryzae TaxID=2802053 RepID=UPI0019244300|nr:type II toxin-antitoxin system HicB family antitoxin [Methylomicrobium sp. RS1]MBL1264028.1 type II toxin-antitoxin system HicB family antitoxin [Methylomicrobium sp. RS1]